MQRFLLNLVPLVGLLTSGCKVAKNQEAILTAADAGESLAYCGQESLAALARESKAALNGFHASSQIETMVPDLNAALEANQAARANQASFEKQFPWTKAITLKFEDLRTSLFKNKGKASGLMNIEWDLKPCEYICFNERYALVRVNPLAVDKNIKTLGLERGTSFIFSALAHELGHFIVDHYFLKIKKIGEDEYFNKILQVNYLANHLLVDGVAMTAINFKPTLFAQILNNLGPIQKNGLPLVTDDQKARIKCLQGLK